MITQNKAGDAEENRRVVLTKPHSRLAGKATGTENPTGADICNLDIILLEACIKPYWRFSIDEYQREDVDLIC